MVHPLTTQTISHLQLPFYVVSGMRAGRPSFALRGELDQSCSDLLSSVELDALDEGPVTLDFAGLRFVDTAGVRALVELRERALAGGHTVEMVNPTALVRRVFTLLGRGQLLAAS
jgi:anti-anti-sigma factor